VDWLATKRPASMTEETLECRSSSGQQVRSRDDISTAGASNQSQRECSSWRQGMPISCSACFPGRLNPGCFPGITGSVRKCSGVKGIDSYVQESNSAYIGFLCSCRAFDQTCETLRAPIALRTERCALSAHRGAAL
jgi:hypothetical protein